MNIKYQLLPIYDYKWSHKQFNSLPICLARKDNVALILRSMAVLGDRSVLTSINKPNCLFVKNWKSLTDWWQAPLETRQDISYVC